MKALSVIIPTLNEERYLIRLLGSISRNATDYTLQIIIVDGQSEDKTVQVIEQWRKKTPPNISLLAITSDHRNIALQRNQGAKLAQHETLLFLDADLQVPSAQVFAGLIKQFDEGGYAAASCRFTSIESDWRAKIYFFIWTQLTRLMQFYSPNVLGACIITTKTVFHQCKGFDSTITIGEDANYCLRALQFGAFRILAVTMEVSARRFRKHGYCAMGWEYIKIFIYRAIHGEYRLPRPQRYDFGDFTDV